MKVHALVAGAAAAVLAAGCGSSGRLVEQQATSSVPPTTITGSGRSANERAAQAEAKRLLGLVAAPPGSVRLTRSPSALLSGPAMGTPATKSLIDYSSFWKVPISTSAALAWFEGHAPGGLARSGSASTSSHGITARGLGYDAPSGTAWTGASVEVGIAPAGPDASFVRADGVALWIDPVPLADSRSGPRMHIAVASGCTASDRGFVGVTNPPPPLDRSLLPAGKPTAGLVCEYYGLNGHPFALEQKTVLGAVSAGAFASKVQRLPLGHLDGEVVSCPSGGDSATVVALAYPGGKSIDLWMTTSGCTAVSNGSIRAAGSVRVP